MAKSTGKKRSNGSGSIKYCKGNKNPYMARVSVEKMPNRNGKIVVKYKSIGSFKTKKEAEKALLECEETPLDLTSKVKTFEDLYYAWSESYFAKISPTAIRSVTSAYAYCSMGYKLELRKITTLH